MIMQFMSIINRRVQIRRISRIKIMIVENFLQQKVHKCLIIISKGIDYLLINPSLIIIIYRHAILIIEIAVTILLSLIITINSRQHCSIQPRELNNTHLVNFHSLDMIISVKITIYLAKHQI